MALRNILIFLFLIFIIGISASGPLSSPEIVIPSHDHDTEHNSLIHTIPKDDCKKLLNYFSEKLSIYTQCTTVFARPIRFCLRCHDQYINVLQAYNAMENYKQDNISCKDVLTRQDRLNIIDHIYNDISGIESIWEEASCKNCYENNDPHDVEANHSVNFHKLWQATIDCFSKYTNESIINDTTPNPDDNFEDQVKKLTTIFETTGSLCTNCSEVYNEMRKYFWNHVVPSNDKETIGGVCYDIRDAFNYTGTVWKENFNCEPKPATLATVLPAIILTFLMIVLVYTCEPFILSWIFPGKIEQQILIAQQDVYEGEPSETQDDNNEIDGSFEVVPGVTADEYIKRFSTIEISNPTDRRNFRIRVPPAPETFYDIEWHNEEWVLPPKDFFVKMHAVIDRWRNEEISQREMDLLHCKIIVEELARKRKSQKPNRSGRRTSRELRNFNSMDGSRPHHSSGDSSSIGIQDHEVLGRGNLTFSTTSEVSD